MTRKSLSLVATVGLVTLLCAPSRASAQISPSLGAADPYSVLAGTQVTNAGPTTISGSVGISPGAAGPGLNHPGLLPAQVGGTIHDGDAGPGSAAAAQFDKGITLLALNGQLCPPANTFAGVKELAGVNLVPGVYCAGSFHLTAGTLTLTGSASDTWIFKSASDLVITGGGASKVSSPSCNVWWTVVSSASFDAGSSLVGNILADTAITFAAGASLSGRALARTALVSLSSNAISACVAPAGPTPTPSPSPTPRPNACATSAPDLFLVKTHVNPFVTGTNATYSLALGNNGVTSVGAITVIDTLPATVAFVSAAGVGWTCTAAGQVVSCTTTASLPGSITLIVTPGINAVPAVTNNAVVSGGGDCDLTNNGAADVATVSSGTPGTPIPVPTLSEWAFITLAVLLAAAGFVALGRRASA